MKNLLKKFGFQRLIVAALAAFACICMWGCSEDRVRWNEGFSGAEIVGFVDDSLVMVGSYQMRTESHEGIFEPYWDVVESGHERLCVYNYRVQENGPRWCDTLGEYNMTNAFRGQMTDSMIWGGDMPNSIRLWKIGESQHQIKLKKLTEGCSGEFGITSVKQWLDGKFIARGDKSLNAGGDSCQYAVLDTLSRMLTYKRLDKDLEWIKACDDVKTWDDDVYCLKFDKEERTSSLFVNDNLKYILENDYFWTAGAVLQFQGHILLLERDVCRLENGKIKCFASASSSGISFKNREDDAYITY
ncbi:MAG: hypothetical protein IIU83_01500 [Fibrobacteraceae bacterium]|nr:hypothetical protein [Fibrobacteraceae bacterium]